MTHAIAPSEGTTASHSILITEYRELVMDAEKHREKAADCERRASILLQKIIDRGLTP